MNTYSMTSNTLLAKLDTFKANVDGAFDALGNMPITLKKVGGLYHWRVGNLGGSIYVKRDAARRATKPVKYVAPTQEKLAEPIASHETTIRDWEARMLIGTRMT